jgi:hypothetical protein
MEDIMTNFILVKHRMQTQTRNIKAVKEMIALGWKIKISKLGELL